MEEQEEEDDYRWDIIEISKTLICIFKCAQQLSFAFGGG